MNERPRVKVYQGGHLVGSIPRLPQQPRDIVSFVMEARNRTGNPLVTLRRTDFLTEWRIFSDGWTKEVVLIADPSLGIGDLEDIRGFRGAAP